ncbi:FIP (Fungus-Induced Protein) Related [Caenorhabditis elegans]|uniref:FIP (Fungus-Induced Protein) Related n=1 Tax=Caenorhabditis elegans TaxID=6239 RepID=Q23606_CAEEL|nr:FIP (Fungus-Induced Protein) Related [Caenorhabditis elegans]CCD63034.1 FIP (Fungus-Induced Protein) Related [Caenorhabditis elegans]|eukprot:NP_508595.2 Uncharacterized protein CELE_ZK813.1 [Caenorhabditis elegans]
MKLLIVLLALIAVVVASSYGAQNDYPTDVGYGNPGYDNGNPFYKPRKHHRRRHGRRGRHGRHGRHGRRHSDSSDSSSESRSRSSSGSSSSESRSYERDYYYVPRWPTAPSYGNTGNDVPAGTAYGSPANDPPAPAPYGTNTFGGK